MSKNVTFSYWYNYSIAWSTFFSRLFTSLLDGPKEKNTSDLALAPCMEIDPLEVMQHVTFKCETYTLKKRMPTMTFSSKIVLLPNNFSVLYALDFLDWGILASLRLPSNSSATENTVGPAILYHQEIASKAG